LIDGVSYTYQYGIPLGNRCVKEDTQPLYYKNQIFCKNSPISGSNKFKREENNLISIQTFDGFNCEGNSKNFTFPFKTCVRVNGEGWMIFDKPE
jgi:hypothetical protein